MTRKIAIIVAALIIPGGFIALLGAWLVRTLGSSERGRLVMARAHQRLPAWAAARTAVSRQVA